MTRSNQHKQAQNVRGIGGCARAQSRECVLQLMITNVFEGQQIYLMSTTQSRCAILLQSDVRLNQRHDAMLGTCIAVLSKVHALRTSTHDRHTARPLRPLCIPSTPNRITHRIPIVRSARRDINTAQYELHDCHAHRRRNRRA